MPAAEKDRLTYAFGHLVSSFGTDAHAGDSGELAQEVLTELGFSPREKSIIEDLAEHVAGNYQYTGEAEDEQRRIEQGEI